MNKFYKNIEEPIRDAVKLLRDNGINTVCSCGHVMTIDIELGSNIDEVEQIAVLLWDNDYKVFKIECTLQAPSDGFWIRRATIHFNKWM